MDAMGTVIFPLVGLVLGGVMFGWAKPVPIDPRNFTKKKAGLFWVAFAGPLGNIVLAVLSAIFYGFLIGKFTPDFYLYRPLEGMLTVSVFINLILGMFNLIPIPPLDGSRMLQVFLSPKYALKFENLSRFGMLVLLVLVFSGSVGSILAPAQELGVFFLKTSLMIFGVQAVGA
jgi:Zn-dependent protease